jgi:hypothetical protein
MSDKSLVSVFSQAPAATQNTFASENFNTVLYTGNGATQRIGGYINRGAVFNGSSSLVSASGFSVLTEFSISFWINTTTTANEIMFQFDDGSNVNANSIQTNGGNEFFIFPYNPSGGSGKLSMNTTDAATIYDGNWHHFVYTTDGTTELMYLDGSSVSTTKYDSYTTTARTTANLRLGSRRDGYGDFNGQLDQVRIFNKAISSSEVTTLYNETHASTTKSTTDIFGDGSGVALYQLDGNANDTGGASGKYGSAAHFNGSSSKIVADYHGGNSGSFSFWLNVADYDSSAGRQGIISTGSGTNTSLRFVIYDDDKFYWQYGDSGDSISFAQSNVTENTWVHIVATYTTTDLEVYVNNSSVASGTKSAKSFSHGNLQIGNDEANNTWFLDGRVDDLRIYSDVLTSTEVGYIYNNTTASIPTDNLTAHYKFNGDARDETTSPSYDGVASNVKYAYDGTASNVVYQEATSFSPDLVWIKHRDDTGTYHQIYDSVRGAAKVIFSNDTLQEYDRTNGLTSFDSNGFSLGDHAHSNDGTSPNDLVAWCWNAGTDAAASNTDGSITSTVKANTEAGFSIVKYTGNATTGVTIGHGLSSAPEMIIAKSTTVAQNWAVYHKDIGNNYWLQLNGTTAKLDEAIWNDTTPTDSIFTLNNNVVINANNSTNIAYCFHSVDGYQKVDSYTGNNGTQMIDTGFQPQFLLIKNTSSSSNNWIIVDEERSTSNPRKLVLEPNTSDAESTETVNINFTSNGFELTNGNSDVNDNNSTYIYLAIAADPDETTPTVENSFDVVTYDGAGAAQEISTDFKPDLIWFKERNGTANHQIIDSVRGDQAIFPNLTNAQSSQTVVDIEEDGFSFTGDDASINDDGNTMVAWVWKAGDHDDSLPEINTNGTIDSTVSVNDAAGFSIVKYTGNGTAGATIGHGLSSTPQMIIIKNLDATTNWAVYTENTGTNATLLLNSTSASVSVSNKYAGTNSTVFGVNSASDVNTSGSEYIAYCWYSVSGHSKIGSYNGSGAAGNAQNVGFTPRWLMVKRYSGSASNWVIFDTQRTDSSGAKALYADLSNAEATDGRVNLTSTGFDFDGSAFNESNTSWVYMAFK